MSTLSREISRLDQAGFLIDTSDTGAGRERCVGGNLHAGHVIDSETHFGGTIGTEVLENRFCWSCRVCDRLTMMVRLGFGTR